MPHYFTPTNLRTYFVQTSFSTCCSRTVVQPWRNGLISTRSLFLAGRKSGHCCSCNLHPTPLPLRLINRLPPVRYLGCVCLKAYFRRGSQLSQGDNRGPVSYFYAICVLAICVLASVFAGHMHTKRLVYPTPTPVLGNFRGGSAERRNPDPVTTCRVEDRDQA